MFMLVKRSALRSYFNSLTLPVARNGEKKKYIKDEYIKTSNQINGMIGFLAR